MIANDKYIVYNKIVTCELCAAVYLLVHSCFVAYFLLVVSLKYTNIVGDKSLTTIICSLHLLNFAKFIVVYKNIGCIIYVIYRILISNESENQLSFEMKLLDLQIPANNEFGRALL